MFASKILTKYVLVYLSRQLLVREQEYANNMN
jgi:hypothetical protein